jgi:hypothetical protein
MPAADALTCNHRTIVIPNAAFCARNLLFLDVRKY